MVTFFLFGYVVVGLVIGAVMVAAIRSLQWIAANGSSDIVRLEARRELSAWDESAQTIGMRNRWALPALMTVGWLPMAVMALYLKTRR